MEKDIYFMKKAISQAILAKEKGDVPVGCVIVKDDKVISRGYNKRESSNNATAHAEMLAISKACKKINSWRLHGCTLYVTLEPCPMCMGAIMNARVDRVVFGAYDDKRKSLDFSECFTYPAPEISGGILKEDCSLLLKSFFKNRR